MNTKGIQQLWVEVVWVLRPEMLLSLLSTQVGDHTP